MKLIRCAGPPTSGNTMELPHVTRKLLANGSRIAYHKNDHQNSYEQQNFKTQKGKAARKVYSGELCPDHAWVLLLGDALKLAIKEGVYTLFV